MSVHLPMTAEMDAADLADAILARALLVGASDIHLNPAGDESRVFLRVHGRVASLSELTGLPDLVPKAVMQRIKVLAKMQLGEQRRPQDGQMRMAVSGVTVEGDLRIAAIPTVLGERMAIRVIPANGPWDSLENSGMSHSQLAQVRDALQKGGVGVVLGRVGSGKSTTLHAMLRERSSVGATVVTIEDPVERRVDGYQQIEVDERHGLTFAVALRAALRQDPDILMVGEIRDSETAETAVRAGLTGHLVLTTMHADDVGQVAARFLELGVGARYVQEALRIAIWQKLVEIICPDCRGTGCGQCAGIGVLGRRAVFEVAMCENGRTDPAHDANVVCEAQTDFREVPTIRAAARKRQNVRVALGRSDGTGRVRR